MWAGIIDRQCKHGERLIFEQTTASKPRWPPFSLLRCLEGTWPPSETQRLLFTIHTPPGRGVAAVESGRGWEAKKCCTMNRRVSRLSHSVMSVMLGGDYEKVARVRLRMKNVNFINFKLSRCSTVISTSVQQFTVFFPLQGKYQW